MNDASSLFAFRCPQQILPVQESSLDQLTFRRPRRRGFGLGPTPRAVAFERTLRSRPPKKSSRASLSWPRPTTSRLFLRRRRARKLRSPRARLAPARTRDRCRPRRRRASARPRRARASRVRRRRRRRRRAAPPRRPRLRFIVGVFFEGDASPRAPRPRPRTPRRRIRRCE